MRNNYINIVEMIKQFSDKHMDVKRFKSGTLDQFPDFGDEDESYPIIYSVFKNHNINNYDSGYKSITYTFDIYCLVPRIDVIPSESNDILLNQNNNNFNQTSIILNELYYSLDDIYEFSDQIYLYPVHNYLNGLCEGMYGTFTFEVEYNICNIPLSGPMVEYGDDIKEPEYMLSFYHNELNGLNNGDYIHLTSEEYVDFKTIIWTAELMLNNEVIFYSPYECKIESYLNILNSETIIIEVNNIVYTLGDEINTGDEIKVTSSDNCVINFKIIKV